MDRTQRRLTVALVAGAAVVAVASWQWVGRTPALSAGSWSWAHQSGATPVTCGEMQVAVEAAGARAGAGDSAGVHSAISGGFAVAEVPVVNHDRFPIAVRVDPPAAPFRLALAQSLVPVGPGIDFSDGSVWITRSTQRVVVPPGRAAVVQVWLDGDDDSSAAGDALRTLQNVTIHESVLGIGTDHTIPLGVGVVAYEGSVPPETSAVCGALAAAGA